MHRVPQPPSSRSRRPIAAPAARVVRLIAVALATTLTACGDDPVPTAPRGPVTSRPAFDLAATGPAVAVDAGNKHTCALRANGTIACWGRNDYGQATPPGGVFTQVDAGSYYTCAVRADGAVVCWGNNAYGQVGGDPATTEPYGGTFTHTGPFTQVSLSGLSTCALRGDGTIACWGWNGHGQTEAPTGTYTHVSAGAHYYCALRRADATIACWGLDTRISAPAGAFAQLSAGGAHGCALTAGGTIVCWGSNGHGQATPPAGTYTQVSAADSHTCAVRLDGTVICWGAGTTSTGTYPDLGQAAPPSGAGIFTQVSSAIVHTCGLTAGGTIACWGDDSYGQLTPPADLATDFTIPSIAVPADMTVDATSPAGAVVAYTVTATDNIGVTSQRCAPPSGTLFPIGATTVACTAADAAGNAASASFAVTVKGAPDQMTDLGETVEGLDLQQGTETSLKAKLEAALASLAAGNKSAACGQLDAMGNQINANVPTRISRTDADALIADINRIRAATGC